MSGYKEKKITKIWLFKKKLLKFGYSCYMNESWKVRK